MFAIVLRLILLIAPVLALLFWLRWRSAKLRDGVDLKGEIKKLRFRLLWLLLFVVLAIMGIKLSETEKGLPGQVYVPPHMEDGKLVPGRFEAAPKDKKDDTPKDDTKDDVGQN